MNDFERSEWKELLKHNVRIQEVFNRVAIGDNFKILGPYFEAMTIITAVKTLKGGASNYFFSMYLATIGIDKETNKCGLLGKSINALTDKIALLLASDAVFTRNVSLEQGFILKKVVKSVAILSIALGKFLSSKIEIAEDKKKQEISRVYVELILLLLARSNALKKMFKELLDLVGADEKTANTGSEILYLFASLTAGFTIAKKMKGFQPIFELLNPYLQKSFETLTADLVQNEQTGSILKFTNQALLSLKSENCDNFMHTLDAGFEAIGIVKSNLEEDILEIEGRVNRIFEMVTSSLTDFLQSNTEMVVVA